MINIKFIKSKWISLTARINYNVYFFKKEKIHLKQVWQNKVH